MQRRVGRLVRLTAGARFRSLLYTLAQLCFATGNYPLALEHMAEWVQRADDSGPRPHIFMGQVHLQLRDHPAALAHVQTGIRLAEERGVEVQDPWRKLEAYLQSVVENGDESAAFPAYQATDGDAACRARYRVYLPTVKVAPVYPHRALRDRVEGYVDVVAEGEVIEVPGVRNRITFELDD